MFEINPIEILDRITKNSKKAEFFKLKNLIRQDPTNPKYLMALRDLFYSDDWFFKNENVKFFVGKWVQNNLLLLVPPTIHPTFGTEGYPVNPKMTSEKVKEMLIDLDRIEL